MGGDSGHNGRQHELVLIALPGVQQFIDETRSVSDARAASEIYSELTAEIVRACEPAGKVIFPAQSSGSGGLPNRVVALFPEGEWTSLAPAVTRRVEVAWRGWVRQALNVKDDQVPRTPGMPQVQWVLVPPKPGPGGYAEQWARAQALMAARRQVRDFPAGVEWKRRELCGIGPRWPAEPPPAGAKDHEKVPLSAAAWVKRRWRKINGLDGFASTSSIASGPFRQAVLDRLGEPEVRAAVGALSQVAREVIRITQGGDVRESRLPGLSERADEPGRWFASTGGPWVYEDRWQAESLARESKADAAALTPLVSRGRDAARQLAETMKQLGVEEPASHLAVIVSDLDDFGKFLSGQVESAGGEQLEVTIDWHRQVSASLHRAGRDQRSRLEDRAVLGLPVYAGGDDLLAFVPAGHALAGATSCHDAIPATLRRPSTGVCFFHYHASLRDALTSARELLQAAKGLDGKHGLGVGYLRRSGASERSVQPWEAGGAETAGSYGVFAGSRQYRLSPGLLADLDKDGAELARLSADWPDAYRAELTRLVARHLDGSPPAAEIAKTAGALAALGRHEATPRPPGVPAGAAWPLPAARVAVFLRQEAR